MSDKKNSPEEIAQLHSEIFSLTRENEKLKILLKTLSLASTDLISNDVGNLKWLEAEKKVKWVNQNI